MHAIFGYVHARAHVATRRVGRAVATRFHGAASERGQGTVEYVGLILLVSLLMVGMVAAMKGFNN
jgi:plasmid stabilization system protein ParE